MVSNIKSENISLSIIIPVYNAKDWIEPTVLRIIDSLNYAKKFDGEIIIIDDGSSDGSAKTAKSMMKRSEIPIRVISQKNKGRYLARKAGVDVAISNNILFIDSRVFIDKKSLAYLYRQIYNNTDQIWNAHVNIDKKGNFYARFWDAIVFISWRRYFKHPRTTSYTLEEFDYYPKGTTMLYVPKKRLLSAMRRFEKTTNDIKFSSDDTLLIRYMIEELPIHLSPKFSCLYHNRTKFSKFLFHAYGRGQAFVDGFLRPGNRYYWPLMSFLITSPVLVLILIFFPWLILGLIAILIIELLIAVSLGVPFKDAVSLTLLSPVFSLAYGAGLWRGFIRKIHAT